MSGQVSILCVADYYLPGFKGGGPIRTLANLRELLAGEVEFAIFTRDRDLGSDVPYSGIAANSWLETEHGSIFYASPEWFNSHGLKRAMAGRQFDVLYLNSFFGFRSSIELCLAFKKSGLSVLLAPRGEFSEGALAIKKWKKKVFLALARALGLYRNVHWHASTALEAQDILRQFPDAEGKIHIAADPVIVGSAAELDVSPKREGCLRLAFVSRISPKKNLDGLLRVLATVQCQVELDIYGPIEDEAHWRTCQELISALPEHVKAAHRGLLVPDEVSPTFARYDLFAFPTHGENFGHVIFEALRAGTPVLISDQTPWQPSPSGAVTVLPLDDLDAWRHAIEHAAGLGSDEYQKRRTATLEYARHYAANGTSRADNLAMFRAVAANGR
mgnify:CR=1 FL=1